MCHGRLQRGHNPHNVILTPGMGWGHYFLLGDPELSLSVIPLRMVFFYLLDHLSCCQQGVYLDQFQLPGCKPGWSLTDSA